VNAIEARDVWKRYRRYGRRKQFGTLKSALLSGRLLHDLRPDESFEALKGVTFDVVAGKTFGIIGRNGSGKSTMLKLLAGIGKPSSGTIRLEGRASALIELGAGFHPEISGRDNVYINGMMLGLSKREIASRFDEIVAFAELAEFIDAPVKTYSSGMYMRLGFAVAINVQPDVLLVDEVLAVGDEAFTHKCLDKFSEMRRLGRTVVLVTHTLDLVMRFCDEALWLDDGVVRALGDPKRVVDAYLMEVAHVEDKQLAAEDQARLRPEPRPQPEPKLEQKSEPEPEPEPVPEITEVPALVEPLAAPPEAEVEAEPEGPPDLSKAREGRWGSREAEILGVELRRADGSATHVFESGQSVDICMRVRAHQPLQDFVFGIAIFNVEGVCCYGTNTDVEGIRPGELSGDAEIRFTIDDLALVEGTYKLDVAVHRQGGAPYDYHRLLNTFRVTSRVREIGIFRFPHRWTFSGSVRMSDQ
jgi:ABC-type polysaccharide/polyol phosphate transport system ATPase subunit